MIGRGLWIRFRDRDITEAAAQIPAGTNSVMIAARLGRKTGSEITAHFDAFFLAPVGKPLCKGLVPTIGGKDIDRHRAFD